MLNRAAVAVVLAFVFAAACSEQESPGAPSAPIPEGAPAAAAPVVHGAQPVASAADARGGQPRVHNATMGYATVEVDVTARDGGLDVTWSGVSEHAEQVRVRVFVGAGRDAVHDETVGASATSATISGLTNGVGYQVQVDALGPGGFGLGGGRGAGTPRSGVVSVPRPGQVVGVSVSPVAGGLRVSWFSPGGSSHNQYRIDAVAQGVDHRRRHYVDARYDAAVVDRLLNGVTYAVTVRALHRTGGPDGADSVPVMGVPAGPLVGVSLQQVAVSAGGPVCWKQTLNAYSDVFINNQIVYREHRWSVWATGPGGTGSALGHSLVERSLLDVRNCGLEFQFGMDPTYDHPDNRSGTNRRRSFGVPAFYFWWRTYIGGHKSGGNLPLNSPALSPPEYNGLNGVLKAPPRSTRSSSQARPVLLAYDRGSLVGAADLTFPRDRDRTAWIFYKAPWYMWEPGRAAWSAPIPMPESDGLVRRITFVLVDPSVRGVDASRWTYAPR